VTAHTENIEFCIIRQFEELKSLEAEWNALWCSVSDPYVSQSFSWCEQSWRKVASKRGCRLFCVVGRSAGEVVLIWPMVISRSIGCRIISPLGPEGSEYSLVLSSPVPNEFDWVQRAIELVSRCSQADVIRLPYTPVEMPLGKALAMLKGFQFSAIDKTSWVSWRDVTDWQTYLSRVPYLRNRQRRRRGLAKQGEYRFELVEDREKSAETLDWLLRYKYRWMEITGRTNAWLPRQDYADFLRSQIASNNDAYGLKLFRITIDGKIVAAELMAIAPARAEGFIKAYDPEWSKYSPGQQLAEDLIRWAFERGLTYDFRLGEEAYKEGWCNRFSSVISLAAALTLKGALFVACLHLKRALQNIRSRVLVNGISWHRAAEG
jgi:CelD/BcsL family acetyltransferase involved in cellulose biosynthesis